MHSFLHPNARSAVGGGLFLLGQKRQNYRRWCNIKWVKHMASANRDNKLVSVRAHFGMWGIGVYWTLIEFVAEQVKEKSEKVEATLIISDLLGFFGCKRNKLEMFLEYCANIPRTFPEHSSNIPQMIRFSPIRLKGTFLKSK